MGSHRAFRRNGWAPLRRFGFDNDASSLRCCITTSQEGGWVTRAESVFSLKRPVAVLVPESDYEDLVSKLSGREYLYECEPDAVHIHTDTNHRFCWVLFGFHTPATRPNILLWVWKTKKSIEPPS